jgi:hypothetical protein
MIKKRAQHASHDENVLPHSHGDAEEKSAHIMRAVIKAVTDMYPGTLIAVIVMEKEDSARFNYASNCDRKDMIALLEATAYRMRRETQ